MQNLRATPIKHKDYFFSGHLADLPIATASGFIAGTAPVGSVQLR